MQGERVANWKPPTDLKSAGAYLCRTAGQQGAWPGIGKRVKDSRGRVYRMTEQGNLVREGAETR